MAATPSGACALVHAGRRGLPRSRRLDPPVGRTASPPAPGLTDRLPEAHGAAPEPDRVHRRDVPPEGRADACAATRLAPLPRAHPRAPGRSRTAPARSVPGAVGCYGRHGVTN